jgi:hypothetical protein
LIAGAAAGAFSRAANAAASSTSADHKAAMGDHEVRHVTHSSSNSWKRAVFNQVLGNKIQTGNGGVINTGESPPLPAPPPPPPGIVSTVIDVQG